MQTTKINNLFNTSEIKKSKIQATNYSFAKTTEQSALLQEIVEDLIDGILIVTDQRELIYANDSARRVLCKLNQARTRANLVPREIWNICQFLIQSRSFFPNQRWLLESRIFTEDSTVLNIRAQLLNIEAIENPCVLLTVEDRYQTIKNIAVEEAQDYKLTRREKEVWLLHRGHYTYKQIASELCITPNTVKKHMKSIHAKQKDNFVSKHEAMIEE